MERGMGEEKNGREQGLVPFRKFLDPPLGDFFTYKLVGHFPDH